MTTEKLVPIIVKALRDVGNEHILTAFTRYELWLAQMVVRAIEDRKTHYWNFHTAYTLKSPQKCEAKALRNFGISLEDYEWLKGKVENGKK